MPPDRPGPVRVLSADDACPPLPIIDGEGSARAVVWPGSGAEHRSMHLISLPEGGSTIPLRHRMEAVYYVVHGNGVVVDTDDGSENPLVEGSMVHVEPGTGYRLRATDGGIEVLGGPCPPDPALYENL